MGNPSERKFCHSLKIHWSYGFQIIYSGKSGLKASDQHVDQRGRVLLM